jgi:hypothetical protein
MFMGHIYTDTYMDMVLQTGVTGVKKKWRMNGHFESSIPWEYHNIAALL